MAKVSKTPNCRNKYLEIKEKSGVENLQCCNQEITKVITQVNPKDYQCIAMGEYIIFQGNYHPDDIVTYKVPRKDTDSEFDKFPEKYQEEVQKLQRGFNLTKKQVAGLYKTVKFLDNQVVLFFVLEFKPPRTFAYFLYAQTQLFVTLVSTQVYWGYGDECNLFIPS